MNSLDPARSPPPVCQQSVFEGERERGEPGETSPGCAGKLSVRRYGAKTCAGARAPGFRVFALRRWCGQKL